MSKTMMNYNGTGGVMGMMTLETALERFDSAVIESGCITVGELRDEESGPDDGSGSVMIRGSDRNDAVRQVEEALGSEGSRAAAEYVFQYLGGHYSGDARAVLVEATAEQWAEAVMQIPAQAKS